MALCGPTCNIKHEKNGRIPPFVMQYETGMKG